MTALSGKVELLMEPSATLRSESKLPHAFFEGKYYLYRTAQVGDPIHKGSFLRVLPGAKAQLIFENGDQLTVGPGSLFRPQWSSDSVNAQEAKPQMDLPYGKIHALISKSGPRNRLKIRSRAMVLGVRGTEFSVDAGTSGKDGRSDRVSVLRGSVQVTQTEVPEGAHAVTLQESQTAEVLEPNSQEKSAPSQVRIEPTSKEELHAIAALAEPPVVEDAPSPSAVVVELRKKADAVAVADIREYHPEWVPSPSAGTQALSAGELRKSVMQHLQERAPSRRNVQDLEREAYERNFKGAQ